MMSKIIPALLLALLVSFAAGASYRPGIQVDSIRCHGQVVGVGDYTYQLVEACGDPDFREVVAYRREAVEVRGPDGISRIELEIGALQAVEQWVYQPGSGRFTRVLIVQGGILTDIRLAGK